MNRDRVLLEHILECIAWTEGHCVGGRDAFFQDRKTQSAALRELQTLAESAQRLSPELKALRSDIFWQGIAGFRNVLAQDYSGINLERVWQIVEKDLPVLREAVQDLIAKTNQDEPD